MQGGGVSDILNGWDKKVETSGFKSYTGMHTPEGLRIFFFFFTTGFTF